MPYQHCDETGIQFYFCRSIPMSKNRVSHALGQRFSQSDNENIGVHIGISAEIAHSNVVQLQYVV